MFARISRIVKPGQGLNLSQVSGEDMIDMKVKFVRLCNVQCVVVEPRKNDVSNEAHFHEFLPEGHAAQPTPCPIVVRVTHTYPGAYIQSSSWLAKTISEPLIIM